jgi:hypothetical protein
MLEPRFADIVVGGQALQPAVAQPVDAGVADMDEVGVAAAQDQRGKRAGHAAVTGIGLALGVDPAVDGPEASRGGVPHAQDVRQAEIAVDEGAHRKLGGHAPALGPADPIGDDGDGTPTCPLRLRAEIEGGIVLVGRARPALGPVAGQDLGPGSDPASSS